MVLFTTMMLGTLVLALACFAIGRLSAAADAGRRPTVVTDRRVKMHNSQ